MIQAKTNYEANEKWLETYVAKALKKYPQKDAVKVEKTTTKRKKRPSLNRLDPAKIFHAHVADLKKIDDMDPCKVFHRSKHLKWLNSQGFKKIKDDADLPCSQGVYVVVSTSRRNPVLYVGSSKNIRKRVSATNHPFRVARRLAMQPIIYAVRTNSADLLRSECLAIGVLNPVWNFGKTPAK